MLPRGCRIFVATRPVDFRGSFDRLGGIVRQELGDDPRSGALFVFLNRAGDRMKILFFDQTGDCLLYKRLDRRTFRGLLTVNSDSARVEIDLNRLMVLLRGADRPPTSVH
jgi:transposase